VAQSFQRGGLGITARDLDRANPVLADLREHHAALRRSILVAQAGTAVSRRRRGEPNAYNVITIAPPELTFDVRSWDATGFRSTAVVRYLRTEDGWERVAVEAAGSNEP